ncbi:MAG: NUDIX domain-containing protein [Waddliaceae bacterium]
MALVKEGVLGIVFRNNRSEALLLKRRDAGIFVIPGGGIDENESPEEAVIRELEEETSCPVKIVRKIAKYTPINRLTKTTHFYECELTEEKSPQTGPEAVEVGFFPLTALPKPLFYIHHDFIQDATAPLSDCIVKSLSQVTYLNFFIYIFKHPLQFFRFFLSRFSKE